nr:MAG TPA: hypothetical protein [Caudoviricetes sp.]
MALQYGKTANYTAEFAGPFSSMVGSTAKRVIISLPASGWKGAESPFSQSVIVEGISTNSKVDLTADSAQMKKLVQTIIYIENDDGAATAWAIGQKPAEDFTLTAFITEVTSA